MLLDMKTYEGELDARIRAFIARKSDKFPELRVHPVAAIVYRRLNNTKRHIIRRDRHVQIATLRTNT